MTLRSVYEAQKTALGPLGPGRAPGGVMSCQKEFLAVSVPRNACAAGASGRFCKHEPQDKQAGRARCTPCSREDRGLRGQLDQAWLQALLLSKRFIGQVLEPL